jgi:anaerobic ribonucleoside-triphosphate reductase activating protein
LEQNRQIVSDLVDYIKDKSPNTIIYLWSGFTYKELKKLKDLKLKNILGKVDYFIDGLFDESKRDTTLKLRGSSNQNVYHRIKGKLKKINI